MNAISQAYGRPIRTSLICQIAVGLLASLALDGGVLARVVGVAILAFWLCLVVILVRRPRSPSKLDLRIVQWAFWPILVVAWLRQMY